MRHLLNVLIVTGLALGVTFMAVVLGGDSTITVPSPEAVSEQFARQIATRRYDRALQYVDDRSGITLTTVRLASDALHDRGGAVDRVEGEPGRIEGDRATASAMLLTERAGRVRYNFQLARRNGLWKIVEWEIP
jgi:hypothetical protein